jgi:Flp pilus assembly protein TadG
MGESMMKPALALVAGRVRASFDRFRRDERGGMGVFIIFIFALMLVFGGLAVDLMRFEMRRVALTQAMDRAALAAASLTQKNADAKAIAEDWFAKSGIVDIAGWVDFSAPTVTAFSDAGLRRVKIDASVKSRNYFFDLFDGKSTVSYLEGPAVSEAAQGVDKIEVMLVLDITGSMGEPIVTGEAKTKIQALREAATDFVTIVKGNDSKNNISIGMVPYAAQVNIPVNLRQQFNVTDISTWDGVANAGVPNINCVEIPTSTYGSTGLSQSSSMKMAAVADTQTDVGANTIYVAPVAPVASARACSTKSSDPTFNHVMLPTKVGADVIARIARLTEGGNTYSVVAMRWGVALIDQMARPIYTAIGDPSVAGRPVDNNDTKTRKIIVLMTDGDHVTNTSVVDDYKTGLSPIYLGTDGNYAIKFATGGLALTGGTRPTNCMGWTIPASANRNYFLPHMKDEKEKQKVGAAELEGNGTGTLKTLTNTDCDPNSWIAAVGSPTWPKTTADGSDADDERDIVTVPDGPDLDTLPDVVMVTSRQLDWSEVWRNVQLSWMVRQLYMRSAVSGTGTYATVRDTFRATYLTSTNNMDALLQQNCTAAKADTTGGVEIYGIALFPVSQQNGNGATQIRNCSSPAANNDNPYYYPAATSNDLKAAFRKIALDISELRLTQ